MQTRVFVVAVDIHAASAVCKSDRQFLYVAYETCSTLVGSIDITCNMQIPDSSTLHIAERGGILFAEPILTGSIADGQRISLSIECSLKSSVNPIITIVKKDTRHRGDRILSRTDVGGQLHGCAAIGAKTIVYT